MNHLLATVLGALVLTATPALADGDATKGAVVFKKCMACHEGDKPVNKTGPYLMGIVGRPIASVEGFNYSAAMKTYAETAKVWDEATLDVYLSDPRKTVPGTKMALAPQKKPEERADLIAYLKTLPAP